MGEKQKPSGVYPRAADLKAWKSQWHVSRCAPSRRATQTGIVNQAKIEPGARRRGDPAGTTAAVTAFTYVVTEFDWLDITFRLGAAVLAGLVLGINRDLAGKPIGMRTLALVALGAAVVSLATIQFHELSDHPDALSRVVQGIIQGIMGGISFIGAGVILRDARSHRVEGLTTAATVWVTAAFGIACAVAAWRVLVVATVLAMVLLFAGHVTERLVRKRAKQP